MTTLQEQLTKSKGLLRAVDVAVHLPAFIAVYSTYVLATFLSVGITWIATKSLLYGGHFAVGGLIISLGSLLAALVALVGISAAGYLLNDKLHGREVMSIRQAFVSSIASFPRLIGVLIILSVFALLAIVVVFIAMFICKLPAVGPVLFFVVFPISAVFLGIVFYACALLATIAGPSIWARNNISRTISLMASIFRERLISVTVQLVLLSLLIALVMWLIFAVLMAGGITASTIATSTVTSDSSTHLSPFGFFGGFVGSLMSGDVGGYFFAIIFGMSLLFGLASSIGLLVAIAGSCIIFANATEGLSTKEMDEKLRGSLTAVRQNIDDARRRLKETPTNTTAATSSALLCTQCATPYQSGEMFCGNCGHKLG